jgi:hypothetical protein
VVKDDLADHTRSIHRPNDRFPAKATVDSLASSAPFCGITGAASSGSPIREAMSFDHFSSLRVLFSVY